MLRWITTFALGLATACGGASSYKAGAMAPAAPSAVGAAGAPAGNTAVATPTAREQLIIEGWLSVEVENVQRAANDIRARVEAAGGRLINEQLSGSSDSWSGNLKMRLPPASVAGFVGWIDGLGTITSKRIQGTDVSRQLFDQQIALDNLTVTLDRMRALLAREGLEMKDILAIEAEMTRLRGEIERIKGEKRFLEDRVAFATVDITLSRREGVILGPEAKFYPGVRAAALTLIGPGGRARNRVGVGAVVHTVAPGGTGNSGGRVTLELDMFEDADGDGKAALATVGGAVYSDFLGRGKRAFLNPYLGFRLGYGYLDGSRFAFGATAGVELFKHEFVMVDVNVRGMGLLGDEFDTAVVTGGNLVFAF